MTSSDSTIEEVDLPDLAGCFDNTDDYVERLGLSPAQQTDVNEVKAKTVLNRTQAGMKLALKYWVQRLRDSATYRVLLAILLSLIDKGDVAVRVCKYLSDKCE